MVWDGVCSTTCTDLHVFNKSSHGRKMRLPPTKNSLPVKTTLTRLLFLLVTQINEQNIIKLFLLFPKCI
jgi:hypothetical protein